MNVLYKSFLSSGKSFCICVRAEYFLVICIIVTMYVCVGIRVVYIHFACVREGMFVRVVKTFWHEKI